MTFSDKNIIVTKKEVFSKDFPQFYPLVVTTSKKIREFEFKISKEEWLVTGNNQIILGSIDIIPSSMQGPRLLDIGFFTFSLRSSTNGKYALSFLSGAKTDILASITGGYFCLGESSAKRRQTTNLHIEDALEEAISKFSDQADQIATIKLDLKKKKMTIPEVSFLLIKCAEKGLIPFRSIEAVNKGYRDLDETKKISVWDFIELFEPAWYKLGGIDRFEFFKNFYPLIQSYLG